MRAQKLKARKACLTCLKRRKKCDGTTPTCDSCKRLNLRCTWREDGPAVQSFIAGRTQHEDLSPPEKYEVNQSLLTLVPGYRNRDTIPTSITGGGFKAFQTKLQFDLVLRTPTYYGGFVCASAPEEFRDASIMTTMALQNDWFRDCVACFSAFCMQDDDLRAGKAEHLAMGIYQSALQKLREHITASPTSIGTLEVALAITFLGTVESLGTGDAQKALQHFTACVRLCRYIPVPRPEDATSLKLYRIITELWLFQLSTLSIFLAIPINILQSIDWKILDTIFGNPIKDSRIAFEFSPHLGGMHAIYKIILEMTVFSRRDYAQSQRDDKVTQWMQETISIERSLDSYFSQIALDIALLYHTKSRLYLAAIRIFLAKIKNKDLRSSHPQIRTQILAARAIFAEFATYEPHNPALAWPLVIFLCACDGAPDDLAFFKSTIRALGDNFDKGHKKRFDAVLELVEGDRNRDRQIYTEGIADVENTRSYQGKGRGEFESTEHDTLDMLCWENGILG